MNILDERYCPECGTDWQGKPIPQGSINKGYYRKGLTHFSKLLGYYDVNQDRTVSWHCPECAHSWPRE